MYSQIGFMKITIPTHENTYIQSHGYFFLLINLIVYAEMTANIGGVHFVLNWKWCTIYILTQY